MSGLRQIFIIVTLLIVYGSLFPFSFEAKNLSTINWWDWLFSFEARTTRGDILGNVLLFIPFGFFGALGFSHTDPAINRRYNFILILAGFAFAVLLQGLQLFLPSRVSTAGDAWANTTGLLLGIILMRVLASSRVARWFNSDEPTQTLTVPVILVACWLGYHWFPFIPSFDWLQIKFSFKPLSHWHLITPYQLVDQFLAWLMFWYFLDKLVPRQLSAYHRLAIIGVIMIVQILLVRNLMSLNSFIASVTAVFVFQFAGSKIKSYWAALLLFWLLFRSWYPFSLNDSATIHWIPFASYLSGSLWINSYQVFENLFFYGASFYLLNRWLHNWMWACGLLTGWLLIVELGQIWIGARAAEFTDPLIAFFLSLGFARLQALPVNRLSTSSTD